MSRSNTSRKGFAPILLLTFVLSTCLMINMVSVIWMFTKLSNLKQQNVPKILLSNNLSVGNTFIWGVILLLIGLFFLLTIYICYTNYEGETLDSEGLIALIFIILFIALPFILNGFLFIQYYKTYKKRFGSTDYIAETPRSSASPANQNKQQTQSSTNRKTETGSYKNGNYTYTKKTATTIINNNNIEDISEIINNIGENLRNSTPKTPKSWNCKHCGATNNETDTCEYCGNSST